MSVFSVQKEDYLGNGVKSKTDSCLNFVNKLIDWLKGDLICKIKQFHIFRSIIPDVALTSDFIAGFCGETDEDFEATVSLVQTVGYHKCFMYPYSLR